MNMKYISKLAREMGLILGKGLYNGQPYWIRAGSTVIITPMRVMQMAGYVGEQV